RQAGTLRVGASPMRGRTGRLRRARSLDGSLERQVAHPDAVAHVAVRGPCAAAGRIAVTDMGDALRLVGIGVRRVNVGADGERGGREDGADPETHEQQASEASHSRLHLYVLPVADVLEG